MSGDTIDKLDDAFDTSFDAEENKLALLKNEVKDIEERTQRIINGDKLVLLQDQDFLRDEIKSLIVCSRTVLQKLEADIKMGSNSKMHEAYAKMITAITGQYAELRMLNKSVIDMFYMRTESNALTEEGKTNNISLTSEQLVDIIKKAQETNSMNAIDAHFTIDDTGIKELRK